MDFYACHMMMRGSSFNPNYLFFGASLGSKFQVDVYAKIETERLNYREKDEKGGEGRKWAFNFFGIEY